MEKSPGINRSDLGSSKDVNLLEARNRLLSDLTGLQASNLFCTLPPKLSYEIQLCLHHICNRAYKTIQWQVGHLPTAILIYSFIYYNHSFKK